MIAAAEKEKDRHVQSRRDVEEIEARAAAG
jgi:hypothetical protein